MPLIEYFGSASSPTDNGTANEPLTQTVTPPSNMKKGDLVVLVALERTAAPSSAHAISATGGQTWSAAQTFAGANSCSASVFSCTYNGTWSADPSVVYAAEGGTIAVTTVMHVFRSSAPVRWILDTAIAGGAEASASPVVISGISPTQRVTITLACWVVPNASTWGTLSGTGWAVTGGAQYRNTAGSDLSGSFAHCVLDEQGETGDVSLVPSSQAAGISFTIVFAATPVDTGYMINHRR